MHPISMVACKLSVTINLTANKQINKLEIFKYKKRKKKNTK